MPSSADDVAPIARDDGVVTIERDDDVGTLRAVDDVVAQRPELRVDAGLTPVAVS